MADAGYYLDLVARSVEDYYVGSGEAPGEWLGVGARALSLAGKVDGGVLGEVLAGGTLGVGSWWGARRPRRAGWRGST